MYGPSATWTTACSNLLPTPSEGSFGGGVTARLVERFAGPPRSPTPRRSFHPSSRTRGRRSCRAPSRLGTPRPARAPRCAGRWPGRRGRRRRRTRPIGFLIVSTRSGPVAWHRLPSSSNGRCTPPPLDRRPEPWAPWRLPGDVRTDRLRRVAHAIGGVSHWASDRGGHGAVRQERG
jgi:hypothetical protein